MLAPSLLDDRIQRTTYDDLSRPTRIVGGYRVLGTAGAGNVEIELGYTLNGQVDWRRDGNTNPTDYRYDSYDRLDRTTFPDTSYEQLAYDARGLVTQRRNRAGRLINHAYDGAGRLTDTTYDGTYVPSQAPVAYQYDPGSGPGQAGQGREVRIERDAALPADVSLITIAYDALGRRASETQDGRTVSWLYDIAGRPTRQTWPDGFYVTCTHTPAAQLLSIR